LTLATNLGIGVLPNGGACGFDAKGLPGSAMFFKMLGIFLNCLSINPGSLTGLPSES
jgi:hypothetical protein